jgi:hypothetical protein
VTPSPSARRARLPWIVAAVAVVVALASVGALVRASAGESTPVGEPAPVGEPVPGRSGESADGERGFASPEDAVGYFVARVAAGDLAGATEAFAVRSMVDGFSFQAYSERYGVVSAVTWLPESSAGYLAINEDLRRGDVARQLCFFVEAVAAPGRDFGITQTLTDDLTAADIEADLSPEHLAGLSLVRVDDLNRPGDDGSEVFDAIAELYGADELREVAVLYGTADGSVRGGMQLLRFGDEWYVWNMASNIMGTIMGEVEPMSELEYLADLALHG